MSRLGSVLNGWGTAWSRLDPDRRNGILLFSGLGIVVAIALALIGYGYYTENISYRNDTVLTIGEREFDYTVLERRLTYDLRGGGLGTQVSEASLQQAVLRSLFAVEEDELLRQGARDLGIVVSDEELDARLRSQLGVPDDQPEAFASSFRNAILRSGLSRSEFVAVSENPLLVDKLRTFFGDAVPAEDEQVELLLILTSSQETGAEAKQRLDDGEEFAAVAADTSLHASAREGGAAGWFPHGSLPSEVEEAAFSLGLGETSDVIEAAAGGFYVIQPQEREVRPIDEDQRQDVVDRSVEDLLVETRERVGSRTSLTALQLTTLMNHALSILIDG